MVISPGHFKQINNDISLFQWWFDFNAKLICNRKVYLLIGMRPIVYMPQSACVQGIEYSNTIWAIIQSWLMFEHLPRKGYSLKPYEIKDGGSSAKIPLSYVRA